MKQRQKEDEQSEIEQIIRCEIQRKLNMKQTEKEDKQREGLIAGTGRDYIAPPVRLLEDRNSDVREKVSGAIAQLSYNEADRAALANSRAILQLVDMLQDESEEMRDNAAEALVNFTEDPSLGDRISYVLNSPSFQNMQERLTQIRASDAHLAASLRHVSFEQLTMEHALI
ncbi:hypothetical protein A4A49_13178 [Nicotiana attenuata]|uniref:Uncharacterized protein n=1 Tax=Nicotiana attenuata TaxID=49451 RepID=A0A1J6IR35_NICAT|nr:hypothetical protein A4A49_13178 [Nicotiana attenuata]